MTEPRAMTEEECREALLNQIAAMFKYWRDVKNPMGTQEDVDQVQARLEGFLHSLLVIFDGGSVLPAFNISPAPHPDDEQFHRDEGTNWWPTGVVINNVQLHEMIPWDKLQR